MSRISTICWHDGYNWTIGNGYGGGNGEKRKMDLKLSDMKANGVMDEGAFVIRLPRRCVQDFRGRVYLSEQERATAVRERIVDMMARDRCIC